MAFGGRNDKAWLTAGALCVALLVLPGLALLIAPHARSAARGGPAEHTRVLPFGTFGETAPEPTAVEAATEAAPPPTDAIAGVVEDQDGKPVARANVGCDAHRDGKLWTATDEEGRFSFPTSAEGCTASAEHAEYARSSEDQLYRGHANRLRLKAPGGIEGVVVDENDAPVAAYFLGIESFTAAEPMKDEPHRPPQAFTSRDGTFKLEKLVPGRYVLSVAADGRPPTHGDPLQIESGRSLRGVRLVLANGAHFPGRVVDAETKKPILGATIALDSVSDTNMSTLRPAISDASGAFDLDGAPPGPFSVRVSHGDYRTKIVPGLTTGLGAPPSIEVELNPRGDGGDRLELSGVGIRIMFGARDRLRIAGLEPDGPAMKAGVEASDFIRAIDAVDVATLTLAEATQRLRGTAGSTVTLRLDRGGATVDVEITRAEILAN